MRVLVIGGTGFIGQHIVQQFARAGHSVAIFHRGNQQATLPENVEKILDPDSTTPIVKFPACLLELRPDVVVHTMAMGSADAQAAVGAFRGRSTRLVMLSSGDVYRAYGRLLSIEPGPLEVGLLREGSPLRTVLYPYRSRAASAGDLAYWYEKILAEQALLGTDRWGIVLRLPKVYGPASNADLATVYRYMHHPNWR